MPTGTDKDDADARARAEAEQAAKDAELNTLVERLAGVLGPRIDVAMDARFAKIDEGRAGAPPVAASGGAAGMGGRAHDAAVGGGGDDAAARRDAIQRDVEEQRTRPADEGAPQDGQEWSADYSRDAREAAVSNESSGIWRWPMYRVLQENYDLPPQTKRRPREP